MKTLRNSLFLTGCLLAYHTDGVSQRRIKKNKVYNAILSTVFQGGKYKGALIDVGDSSVTISSKGVSRLIPSNSIKNIKFKRTGSVGRGAAVGALTGFFLGLSIGLASGDEECPPGTVCINETTATESGLAGGLVIGATGSVIGVIVGATSTHGEKIAINGDRKIFVTKREEIARYVRPR
jgi:hypothetical protein